MPPSPQHPLFLSLVDGFAVGLLTLLGMIAFVAIAGCFATAAAPRFVVTRRQVREANRLFAPKLKHAWSIERPRLMTPDETEIAYGLPKGFFENRTLPAHKARAMTDQEKQAARDAITQSLIEWPSGHASKEYDELPVMLPNAILFTRKGNKP